MIVSLGHQSKSYRGECYQLLNPIYPGDFVKIKITAFLSAIAVFSPIVWLQPASAARIIGTSVSGVADILDTQDDYSSNQNGATLRDITLSTSASSGGGSTRGTFAASFGTVRAVFLTMKFMVGLQPLHTLVLPILSTVISTCITTAQISQLQPSLQLIKF
jgi:hypothetical protein